MRIDVDSWEIGYDDGQFGRPSQFGLLSQFPITLDWFSYSSGYCEGRAYRARRHHLGPQARLRPLSVDR